MPLSENELRQLEAIERGLLADDPKFAATVRSSDLPRYYRRRLVRACVLFVVGLALLICFVVNVWVGIAGFVCMFAATVMAATAVKKLRHPGDQRFGRTTGAGAKRASAPKQGWRERAEERFRRRFDDRN